MSYPLTLTTGTPYTSDDYGIWIDFNQDGDFYDTGENVVCEIDNGLASHTWDIAIPSDAMQGETRMRIRLKYSGSDCGDPCGTTTYGEVEDYTVVISGGVTPPECDVFFDDFESYNVGEQLVSQNPDDWTTWSNSPGSAEDPYIVDNGGNVVEITGTNDLVYVMDNYTSGFYTIMFDMYIPTGADGYFNTLQDFAGTASSWGMQVYFGETNVGEGNLDAGLSLRTFWPQLVIVHVVETAPANLGEADRLQSLRLCCGVVVHF